jgi:hypothetical protein
MDFVLKNHWTLTLKYFNLALGILSLDLQLLKLFQHYHLRISSNFHYALKQQQQQHVLSLIFNSYYSMSF